MVIAFAGIDGAGKSSAAAGTATHLAARGRRCRLVDRWDIVANPAYPAARFLAASSGDIRACTVRMSSQSRLLFLTWAATAALLDEDREPPDAEVRLLDGYWMKHAASEVTYGLDRGWVEALVAGLPRPDLVVHLRLDPAVAWRRKDGAALPYECGMDLMRRESSFVRHQGGVARLLDDWAERFGWTTFDAETPLATIAERVADRVTRHGEGVR